jgi:predicted neutral ceramidase superfamily lipid hydrolase
MRSIFYKHRFLESSTFISLLAALGALNLNISSFFESVLYGGLAILLMILLSQLFMRTAGLIPKEIHLPLFMVIAITFMTVVYQFTAFTLPPLSQYHVALIMAVVFCMAYREAFIYHAVLSSGPLNFIGIIVVMIAVMALQSLFRLVLGSSDFWQESIFAGDVSLYTVPLWLTSIGGLIMMAVVLAFMQFILKRMKL